MKRMIRRGIACLLALLMLVTSSGIASLASPQIQVLPGAGENLLVNGDFEDLTDEVSWTLSETASVSKAAAYSGSYGLRLTRGEIDAKATYLFTQVALAPNTTYTVTGDVRSTAGSDPEVSFEVTGGTATTTKGSVGTLNNTWSHQTFLTIQTGSDFVYGKLTLSIYRGGSATTDFDNVTMIATGEEWCPTPTGRMVQQTETLYDDFNDPMLDTDKWLVSEKGWGGANGGLAAANTKLGVEDGRTCVILESHGDRYEGNVKGVGGATKRVGAGFATKDYFASAEYKVVCKIDNTLGVCTAFWSFSYIQYEEGDAKFNELVGNIRNTEIDWETPSPMDNSGKDDHVSLENLRTNCWGGKRPGEGGNYSGRGHNTNEKGEIISIADGKWHDLTYKWYSTAEPRTGKPAVVWYIDGKEVDAYDINNPHYNDGLTPEADPNNYEALKKYYDMGINVPYRGARFWLACWFPVKDSKLYLVGNHSATTGWAGTPDFDVAHTYIDSVKITPYMDQSMDEYGDRETVPNLAWALPNQYDGYAETHGVMDAPTPETTITGQTVVATWNAIPGATGYDVKMDGKDYSTNSTTYKFDNLNVGNHTLQVRAKNGKSTGIWSYEAMVSIGVPTVTAVADGTSIKVTWDPVPGAEAYYLDIDNDPIIVDGAYVSFQSGVVNKYLSSKEEGLHMIRVRAAGPKGMSNWSQQKYVLIGKNYELKTPTLTVTKTQGNEHELNFTSSSVTNATGYQLLDTQTGEQTEMTGTTCKKTVPDGTYTYKVRAKNDIGPSEWSSEVTVVVGSGTSPTTTTTTLPAPSTTTTTGKATTTTTTTTAAPTTTTTVPDGEAAVVGLKLLKKAKWSVDDVTENYAWKVRKGTPATITVTLKEVYKAGEKETSELLSLLTMDSAFTLVGDPVVGPTVNHNNDVTYTYTVTVNSDTVFDGTAAYYKDDAEVVVDMPGATPVPMPTPGTTTTTAKATTAATTTTTTTTKATTTTTTTAATTKATTTTTTMAATTTTAVAPTTTTTTTKATTTTTLAPTTTTKAATTTTAADDTIIYDADVSATLGLYPGAIYTNEAIRQALQNETARYGIAKQYLITVTGSADPADYIYPILLGENGAEVWPASGNYSLGAGGTVTGTIGGGDFAAAEDAPNQLYFYADSENATLDITHVKIQVVRGDVPTPTTTTTAEAPTTTTVEAPTTTTAAEPTTTTEADITTTTASAETTTAEEPTTTTAAPDILLGDANRDESVDMKDVLIVRKFIANMGVTIDETASDVNLDRSIDMKDVLMIRKWIAKIIEHF